MLLQYNVYLCSTAPPLQRAAARTEQSSARMELRAASPSRPADARTEQPLAPLAPRCSFALSVTGMEKTCGLRGNDPVILSPCRPAGAKNLIPQILRPAFGLLQDDDLS